ncbi:MAG: PorT family protein [Schleiferiaceae bacterium]|nr:PorT family protein [Schleiferiaceae bacterium]
MVPPSGELTQKLGYSLSFAFMGETLFGHSHWSLGYGLGFGAYHYNNNLNITTNPNTQLSEFTFLTPDTAYQQNRQIFQYIEVPLELRYRTTSNKKGRYLRIYPHVKFGFNVRSYTVFVNEKYSTAHFNIQQTNWYRVSAGVRLGYWIFNLYANYELTPMYKEVIVGNTDLSQFRTLNVGLSLSF